MSGAQLVREKAFEKLRTEAHPCRLRRKINVLFDPLERQPASVPFLNDSSFRPRGDGGAMFDRIRGQLVKGSRVP